MPYVAASTYHHDETRDCLRARAYGNRALGVLVRVTPHQGAWEGHVQGEAAQGEELVRQRARDVRILNQGKPASGEPRDTENGPAWFGKGRREKARQRDLARRLLHRRVTEFP